MKLTKKQKETLSDYGWDLITASEDGEAQDCAWVSIAPEDGSIYGKIVSDFGLTGEGEDVKLLVIGTSED
jgi:hypothetical protein